MKKLFTLLMSLVAFSTVSFADYTATDIEELSNWSNAWSGYAEYNSTDHIITYTAADGGCGIWLEGVDCSAYSSLTVTFKTDISSGNYIKLVVEEYVWSATDEKYNSTLFSEESTYASGDNSTEQTLTVTLGPTATNISQIYIQAGATGTLTLVSATLNTSTTAAETTITAPDLSSSPYTYSSEISDKTITFSSDWGSVGWSYSGGANASAYAAIKMTFTSATEGASIYLGVIYGEDGGTEESVSIATTGTSDELTLTLPFNTSEYSYVNSIYIKSSAKESSITVKSIELISIGTDVSLGTPNNVWSNSSFTPSTNTMSLAAWDGAGWQYGGVGDTTYGNAVDFSNYNSIKVVLTASAYSKLKLYYTYKDATGDAVAEVADNEVVQTVTKDTKTTLFLPLDETNKSNSTYGVYSIFIQNYTDAVVNVTLTSAEATTTECESITLTQYGGVSYSNTSENLDFSCLSGDATAYYVSAVDEDGDEATLNEFTGISDSNTGLVLVGTASTTVYVPITDKTGANPDGNLLVPTTAGVALTGYYAFGYGSVGLGFYAASVGLTLDAGKAYLNYTGEASGIKLSLLNDTDDETTGISEVSTSAPASVNDNVYYNLSGMRVNTPTKGIYIVNGKKVIIK